MFIYSCRKDYEEQLSFFKDVKTDYWMSCLARFDYLCLSLSLSYFTTLSAKLIVMQIILVHRNANDV